MHDLFRRQFHNEICNNLNQHIHPEILKPTGLDLSRYWMRNRVKSIKLNTHSCSQFSHEYDQYSREKTCMTNTNKEVLPKRFPSSLNHCGYYQIINFWYHCHQVNTGVAHWIRCALAEKGTCCCSITHTLSVEHWENLKPHVYHQTLKTVNENPLSKVFSITTPLDRTPLSKQIEKKMVQLKKWYGKGSIGNLHKIELHKNCILIIIMKDIILVESIISTESFNKYLLQPLKGSGEEPALGEVCIASCLGPPNN